METGQIQKSRSAGNFTIVPNSILKDRNLSFRAKGLMSFLLSLSNDFVIYKDALHKFSTEGRDAIRTAFKELEEAGYILSVEIRNGGRFKGFNYIVYETPHLPTAEKPISEKPTSGNPTLLNNNSTKEQLTKEKNIKKEKENIDNPLKEKALSKKEKVALKRKDNIKQETFFNDFWDSYNHKINKQAAVKAWNKLSEQDRINAFSGVSKYNKYIRLSNKQGFKMYPATYLNGARWNDEYLTPSNTKTTTIPLKVKKTNHPSWMEG